MLSVEHRRLGLKLLQAAFYTVVVVVLARQVWQVRHGLGESLASVGWGAFALAALATTIGTFPGFFGWKLLVGGIGVRLSLADAAWVFFLSGLTRYLPGTIWPTVTQAVLARRVGASMSKLVTASLVGLVLTSISGVVVGLLALPHLAEHNAVWWLTLPVLLGLCAVMLAPGPLAWLVTLGRRVLRRPEQTVTLPASSTSVGVIALNALGWCCNGMHVAVIAMALGAPTVSAVTLGIGGFTLSAVAGAVSLAPAGIGIREVVLAQTLGALLHGPDLVTLVVLSRVLTILGHLVATFGVLGVLAGSRLLRWQAREDPAPEAVSAR